MAPPWKAMMTSQAVWAIIVAHFAENWGFYTLLTGLPMFMRGNFYYIIHKLNLITNHKFAIQAIRLLIIHAAVFC